MATATKVSEVTRGTEVFFAVDFFDESGARATPNSAVVYLYYNSNAAPVSNSVAMAVQSNSTWTASWVTTGDLGVVSWTVASNGVVQVAESGSFRLVGNQSTP